MTTSPSKLAHQTRLNAHKLTKTSRRPHGHYDHAPFEYATIAAIHTSPPTLDIYPMGSQTMGSDQFLIPSVLYLPSYVPTVGDTVLVARGSQRTRSSYFVIGKANGAASPYPTPLGGINAAGQYVNDLVNLWGSMAVPSTALGTDGDWCLSAAGHLYFKSSGAWVQQL